MGGRNIGDEYFDAQPDMNFYDFDVLVTGPVVKQVSTQFDIYWSHEDGGARLRLQAELGDGRAIWIGCESSLAEHRQAALGSLNTPTT